MSEIVVDIANALSFPLLKRGYPADIKIIVLIVGVIAAWLCLASVASLLMPDSSYGGISALPTYLHYAGRNGGMVLFVAAIISPLIIASRCGEASVLSYVGKNLKYTHIILAKVGFYTLISLLSFAIFIFSYSTIKTRIPEMIPYSWDVTFMKMDRLLFLGNDPWVLFAWLYEMPGVLRVMDALYDLWAVILVGTWALCFVCYGYAAKVRFRFPLALLITWFIGGNILAILLSSAGPCYYALVTGLSDPYASQLSTLAALDAVQDLRAVRYQEMLWNVYESPSLGLGGISAMPSMHCATTALLVLFAWKHKIWKWVTLALFTIIFVSSFVLAWHYAVDGLLAIPVALAAWHIAGKILDRALPTKTG